MKMKGHFATFVKSICLLYAVPVLLSTIPIFGQTCVFDPTKNQCVAQGGNLCTSGNGAGSCGPGENACWCYLPGYTLVVTPTTPIVENPGQTASYTVTITPAAGASGFLGTVNLDLANTCPAALLTCSFQPTPSPTLLTSTPASVTLNVTPTAAAAGQNLTIMVNGHDASPNSGPTNGPQPAKLVVGQHIVATGGGGTIALVTFLGLAAVWLAWGLSRNKLRAAP